MEKITRKKFIEHLTANKSVLIYSSFGKFNLLQNSAFMELVYRYKTEKQYERTCKLSNNYRIVFELANGERSTLSFDQNGKYSFYMIDSNNIACLVEYNDIVSPYNIIIYRLIK